MGLRVGDMVKLKRDLFEKLVEAPSIDGFTYFEQRTGKEGVVAYSILNPSARQALRQYLDWKAQHIKRLETALPSYEGTGAVYMRKVNQLKRVKQSLWFFSSEKNLNYRLQRLFIKAGLKNGVSSVSWHAIRDYCFNSLQRTLGILEAKKIVGKAVSKSDSVYLDLEKTIRDKYPAIYQDHFNLDLASVQSQYISTEIDQLRTENQILMNEIRSMKEQLTTYRQEDQLNNMNMMAKSAGLNYQYEKHSDGRYMRMDLKTCEIKIVEDIQEEMEMLARHREHPDDALAEKHEKEITAWLNRKFRQWRQEEKLASEQYLSFEPQEETENEDT